MNDVVLDASALLAILQDEPGSAIVRKALAEQTKQARRMNLQHLDISLSTRTV